MQVKPIADDNSLPSNDGLNKRVESEIGPRNFSSVKVSKAEFGGEGRSVSFVRSR